MAFQIEEAEYQYPTCPSCYEETDFDGDSFVCNRCGIYWEPSGGPGQLLDDSNGVCGETAKRDAPAGYTWEQSDCLLAKGHKVRKHYTVGRLIRAQS